MLKFKQYVLAASFLFISSPMLASSLQCKTIPNTRIKQCYTEKLKLYGLNNMPYALCSTSLCSITQKNSKKARCTCALFKKKGWTSLSVSPNGYEQAKPSTDNHEKLLTVQSNFSLANAAANPHQKTIRCQFDQEKPWANCFGARCHVTSLHTAVCLCPVIRSKTFAISGPGDAKKCATPSGQVWSAIQVSKAKNNSQFIFDLYQTVYPSSPIH